MKKINLKEMKKEIEMIAVASIEYFNSTEENEDQNEKKLNLLESNFVQKYGFNANCGFRLTLNGYELNPIDYVSYVMQNGKPQF